MKIGLVGDSYSAYSVSVNSEATINWYPEVQERDGGKSNVVLYRTPGLFRVATGSNTCRGIYTEPKTGRVFIVNGNQLNEFRYTGSGYIFVNIGTLNNDTNPCQFASNGFEMAVLSGNTLFMLKLGTGVLSTIPDLAPTCLCFHDSYFVVSENNFTFTCSAPFDGYTWPGDEFTAEQIPDPIVALVSDTRQLWVFGSQSFELWGVDGSVDGPFTPVAAAAGLVGSSSRDAVTLLDNTFFFLGETREGNRMAYRAEGYSVRRISNHALEAHWQTYNVVSDAISFGYQEAGHMFWVVSFPYQNETWVYDVSQDMWHQRGYWNVLTGRLESVRGRFGAFGLGYQFCADKSDGRVYIMAQRFLDDDGDVIRRVRRTPHTFNDNKRLYFTRLEVFMQVGIGAQSGVDADPIIALRWSNDGGYTWGNEHYAKAGEQGQYRQRVFWNRLGAARDRVWEFIVTSRVDWVLIGENLIAVEGYS